MSYRVKVSQTHGLCSASNNQSQADWGYEMPRLGLLSQSEILGQDHNGGYSPLVFLSAFLGWRSRLDFLDTLSEILKCHFNSASCIFPSSASASLYDDFYYFQ